MSYLYQCKLCHHFWLKDKSLSPRELCQPCPRTRGVFTAPLKTCSLELIEEGPPHKLMELSHSLMNGLLSPFSGP